MTNKWSLIADECQIFVKSNWLQHLAKHTLAVFNFWVHEVIHDDTEAELMLNFNEIDFDTNDMTCAVQVSSTPVPKEIKSMASKSYVYF